MEKIKAFLKGALLGIAGIFSLTLLTSLILLMFNIELDMSNTLATIYSYGGNANVKFHTLPSLITAILGGVVNLNDYNKKILIDSLKEAETN